MRKCNICHKKFEKADELVINVSTVNGLTGNAWYFCDADHLAIWLTEHSIEYDVSSGMLIATRKLDG